MRATDGFVRHAFCFRNSRAGRQPPLSQAFGHERRNIIHEVKLVFSNRDKAVFLPVAEDESNRIKALFVDRAEHHRFIETTTVFGQCVWLNCAHIVMANFLFEPHQRIVWAEDDIAPSKQYSEDAEAQPEYDQIRWDILMYVRSQPSPLHLADADGNAWVEVFTSIDCEEQFIVLTDDDGEDVAISAEQIDIVIGTEVDRYTQKQIETIQTTMLPEQSN